MVGIRTTRGLGPWASRWDQSRKRSGSVPREHRRERELDRDGDPDRIGGTEVKMERVSRIMTSGITVWLAILAGMSVFM